MKIAFDNKKNSLLAV